MKPEQRVVHIQHQSIICTSTVTGTSNNAGLNEVIGIGDGPARSRGFDDWDE